MTETKKDEIFSIFLLTNHVKLYIITLAVDEAWLSLVERCVRDAEVACSNHVASIDVEKCRKALFYGVFRHLSFFEKQREKM